ncbi:amino acid permease [Austwickia sp. TVS 96-490-7B]|uniref:amino acid permease n=1 Tax=Austwickia sp. TVS 96-490-7B TaxID=2830843 RepID=UPI002714CE1B|nr:amino acid permease [Austwickia sp. TVS 96-490-7B]
MIAIGGAIGTGLFVASGASISQAGPGGALLAYAGIGVMVFLLMQSLGEMATYLPVAGSFEAFGTRFVSASFGFATGWNYWFNWAITVAAELVAASLVMRYWLPDSAAWIWSALFLTILFLLNAASVGVFGESEFWFAGIKVITVLVFLGIGVLMILGILSGPSPGLSNWTTGEAPFVGGPASVLAIFMIAGFSFQGTELIAVAAGEADHPERTIPRAIRAVFMRIMLFYIGAIAVIGFLLPYTDPRLLEQGVETVAVSPFTLVFERAGVLGAATLLNAVILTSILSAGNSGMFASTRMLYALALDGKAPRFLSHTNSRGVPMPALLATTAVGGLCFLTSLMGEGKAYTWLVNASGLAGFITWMGIAWCHYRFRRAYVAQGHDPADLPYRARWFPLGPIVALTMCAVVIVGQNYEALVGGIKWHELASSYIGLPLFLALWFGHKWATSSQMVRLEEADLSRQ